LAVILWLTALVLNTVQFKVYRRSLVVSHFFFGSVMAWQCSICHKTFVCPADETVRDRTCFAASYIDSDFRIHNCPLTLMTRLEALERSGVITDEASDGKRDESP